MDALPNSHYPPMEALPSNNNHYPPMEALPSHSYQHEQNALPSGYPQEQSAYGSRRDDLSPITSPVPVEGAWMAEALRAQRVPPELTGERQR